MRLRRASAIVALSLLTSAATAYAECAWVLWDQTTLGWHGRPVWTEWRYSSQEQCEEARGQTVEIARRARWQVDSDWLVYYDYDTRVAQRTRLTCLPDTVDPRGPTTSPAEISRARCSPGRGAGACRNGRLDFSVVPVLARDSQIKSEGPLCAKPTFRSVVNGSSRKLIGLLTVLTA